MLLCGEKQAIAKRADLRVFFVHNCQIGEVLKCSVLGNFGASVWRQNPLIISSASWECLRCERHKCP